MKQHTTDWISLIFGAMFLVIAGTAIAQQNLDININGVWVMPFLAAVLGVGILAPGRKKQLPTVAAQQEGDTVEADDLD